MLYFFISKRWKNIDKYMHFSYDVTVVTYRKVIIMNWLIFTYKVPYKPSAARVYVWRKLKKIGAYSLLDSVFVLPKTHRHLEIFQWLSEEIREMKGESYIFESNTLGMGKDAAIIKEFNHAVEIPYQEILDKLDSFDTNINKETFTKLYVQFQKIRQKDFFFTNKGNDILLKFLKMEEKIKEGEKYEMDNLE